MRELLHPCVRLGRNGPLGGLRLLGPSLDDLVALGINDDPCLRLRPDPANFRFKNCVAPAGAPAKKLEGQFAGVLGSGREKNREGKKGDHRNVVSPAHSEGPIIASKAETQFPVPGPA